MTTLAAHAALDLSTQPPVATRQPKDVTVHGDKRTDDYFWLREKESPAVLDYLKAENAYTESVTAPAKPLQEKLYTEMVARVKETDQSVPARKGRHVYYTRTEQGKQYPIHCRKLADTPKAPEEIILDINQLAVGEAFMSVGHLVVSDDARLLIYTTDRTGSRDYTVHIKNLETGAEIPQQIGNVASIEWAADNDTIFYVTEEKETKRAYRLERWVLSTGQRRVLLDEKDELYDLEISRTLDEKYLVCISESKTTTGILALPSNQPRGKFRVIVRKRDGVECSLEHRDGLFYILTNLDAKNFRLVSAPVDTPTPMHWTEILPHDPAIKREDIETFANHLVVHERENGLPHIRVIDLASGKQHRIPMPEPIYEVDEGENLEFDTTSYRFTYESPVTPDSTYAYDLNTGASTLLKRAEIPGGYDPALYACERIWASASDKTKIPVSLVWRKDRRAPGPQPLFLYGYGSYGVSIPDSFSTTRLSLLDRGVIYAIAHIRGGGELGEDWRDAGKMALKKTTFTDFIACAESLIASKHTDSKKLIISGGSAGGLLVGAVLNQKPALFRAAILDVPFVDIVNTMLDDTLPLTTSEYIEWGNPNVKAEYAWMRAYSPYDNLKPQAYPAMLVNVSLNDSQVPYWEGAKLVAKLRTLKTDSNPLLLRTNLDAGHGGASGRYDSLKETAFDYAFALTILGL
ncbi:oligopeptidase B [Nibricoccus aquaticus]|uniref:Oligopeptidase B n=1 Tax=Nibricoccus aquaticus TaxID=2576891 RepID=A0A290QC13_9BACT|nr:S9 family peptidase [Nibricoccus aquaticus]ATC66209.1 oligopeptidase B [Nibricoccus aquaticus]